ncbi:hypothetical protein BDZ89DRAFT_955201, partial [Hymenopellis radicata]
PNFPQSLWKKVLLDEAVDFDEINAYFFSTKLDLDPTPVSTVESALHKALGRSAEKKTVSTSPVWFQCFDKYCEAVETVFPYRSAELRVWRRHIDDMFTAKHEESHIRIIAYDVAARKVIATNPAILFDQCETTELVRLRMAFLDKDGVRYDDIGGTGGSGSTSKIAPTKLGRKKEICNNWNEGKCPRNPCPRRHACSSCGGPHIASLCKSKKHLSPRPVVLSFRVSGTRRVIS